MLACAGGITNRRSFFLYSEEKKCPQAAAVQGKSVPRNNNPRGEGEGTVVVRERGHGRDYFVFEYSQVPRHHMRQQLLLYCSGHRSDGGARGIDRGM